MTTIVTAPFDTIVLAGGRSSRMGCDKTALKLNGVPLLTRTCQVGLGLDSKVFVVTSQPDRDGLVPDSCTIVREPVAFQGPLAGLLCGAQMVTTTWVLVVACDMPNLQVLTLRRWSSKLAGLPTTTLAYLPRGLKGWEPLCGFYRNGCWPLLDAYCHRGGRSLQRWLRYRTDIEPIPEVSPEMLFNCNTPTEWEQWLSSVK